MMQSLLAAQHAGESKSQHGATQSQERCCPRRSAEPARRARLQQRQALHGVGRKCCVRTQETDGQTSSLTSGDTMTRSVASATRKPRSRLPVIFTRQRAEGEERTPPRAQPIAHQVARIGPQCGACRNVQVPFQGPTAYPSRKDESGWICDSSAGSASDAVERRAPGRIWAGALSLDPSVRLRHAVAAAASPGLNLGSARLNWLVGRRPPRDLMSSSKKRLASRSSEAISSGPHSRRLRSPMRFSRHGDAPPAAAAR